MAYQLTIRDEDASSFPVNYTSILIKAISIIDMGISWNEIPSPGRFVLTCRIVYFTPAGNIEELNTNYITDNKTALMQHFNSMANIQKVINKGEVGTVINEAVRLPGRTIWVDVI